MSDPTPDQAPEDLLYFNGINGDTGAYDLPPMTAAELAGFITGEGGKDKPENLSELRYRYQSKGLKHLGVKEGVDPTRLDQTGWGLILAHDADPAIKEALSPLLTLRAAQAGERFRLYEGKEKGHRPDESKTAFLARHKMGPGPADPDKVPYYLLICGSPERIPFRFQTQLDVQYAVGRIHFETLDEYANYAAQRGGGGDRAAQAAAPDALLRRRQPHGPGDQPECQATGDAAARAARRRVQPTGPSTRSWREEATKARLGRLLGGRRDPGAARSPPATGWTFPWTARASCPTRGRCCARTGRGPATGAASPRTSISPGMT